jgi:hypothetical protein
MGFMAPWGNSYCIARLQGLTPAVASSQQVCFSKQSESSLHWPGMGKQAWHQPPAVHK